MTSRVQKGGAVFKPVTKFRTRPQIPQSEGTSQEVDEPSTTVINENYNTRSPSLASQESIPDASAGTQSNGSSILESTRASTGQAIQLTRNPLSPSPISLSQRPSQGFFVSSARHDSDGIPISDNTSVPTAMPDATLIFPPNPQTATSDSHLHIDAIQSEDAQISGQTALPVPAPPPIHPARGRTIASSVERLSPPAASSTKRKRVPNDERSVGGPIKRSVKRDQKSPSTAPRSRSSRGPSVSPFDPSADPGEELDPTVTTMAAICSDTGQGRISSKAAEVVNNHAAWKAANREKRARMRDLMERKKYGRSEEDDDDPSRMPVPPPVSPGGIANSLSDSTQGGNAEPDAFDYSQDLATSRYNVQIRIGPNGETVIDEDSLVVDRTEPVNLEEYTHVVESDHTKFVNSGTYGKRYRGARWSAEETERFYEALSQYGENYELIAYVLPGRDRKSCKNKFKAEDKKNHARIEYCLRNTIPMDVRTLSRMTGKDFSGPVPEIRLPPQLPTSTPQPKEPLEEAIRPLSKTRKYSMSTEPELILGNIDDFDS